MNQFLVTALTAACLLSTPPAAADQTGIYSPAIDKSDCWTGITRDELGISNQLALKAK